MGTKSLTLLKGVPDSRLTICSYSPRRVSKFSITSSMALWGPFSTRYFMVSLTSTTRSPFFSTPIRSSLKRSIFIIGSSLSNLKTQLGVVRPFLDTNVDKYPIPLVAVKRNPQCCLRSNRALRAVPVGNVFPNPIDSISGYLITSPNEYASSATIKKGKK